MPVIKSQIQLFAALASIALALSSCADDDTNRTSGSADVSGANESFLLEISGSQMNLMEGGDALNIPITLIRNEGHSATVRLQAQVADESVPVNISFSDDALDANEAGSTLSVQLPIAARPLQPLDRIIVVTATDGSQEPVNVEFSLGVTPTNLPDIYVLAGQSNMFGFSEPDARESGAGEPDARVPRILQLNPTGNDEENFASAADFTDPDSISAAAPRITQALDPLHDGFDIDAGGKPSQFIGPGLTFAKRALQNTTADIVLVPTAWSDTGFCKRDTNIFEGIGWNASEPASRALSGTLLHDRAIARTNQVIEETGGVLRGILWHQGEADSDDAACAEGYAENLAELAESLRTNIAVDARGPIARGPLSDIPFIVGTMSMGTDERGSQLPFSDTKLLVDAAHRNIVSLVPGSAVVNNDDLIPPDYPCGEGSCVHFGAAALREMGSRYYDALSETLP